MHRACQPPTPSPLSCLLICPLVRWSINAPKLTSSPQLSTMNEQWCTSGMCIHHSLTHELPLQNGRSFIIPGPGSIPSLSSRPVVAHPDIRTG